MFTIISIMFVGIGIGYVLRHLQFLQKIEKSTSLTIFLLLFVLGISIGSNSLIINNLGRFGWQAAILAPPPCSQNRYRSHKRRSPPRRLRRSKSIFS